MRYSLQEAAALLKAAQDYVMDGHSSAEAALAAAREGWAGLDRPPFAGGGHSPECKEGARSMCLRCICVRWEQAARKQFGDHEGAAHWSKDPGSRGVDP